MPPQNRTSNQNKEQEKTEDQKKKKDPKKFIRYVVSPIVSIAVLIFIFFGFPSLDTIKGWKPEISNTSTQELLELLPSVDKSAAPAYNRGYFGPAWTDNNSMEYGGNGCSTRNDILARDLSNVVKEDNCKVIRGVLKNDPYTGKDIQFRYGPNTSGAVQIDHVVALKDAWVSGAYLLSDEDRINYANDPDVLLASDGPQNMSKSDKDASKWLVPQNESFRCEYAEMQIKIKTKYRLGVSTDERIALRNQLNLC